MAPTPPNGQIIIEGLVALLFFLGLFAAMNLFIQSDQRRLAKMQKYNGYQVQERSHGQTYPAKK